jgi:hypothetical protein
MGVEVVCVFHEQSHWESNNCAEGVSEGVT